MTITPADIAATIDTAPAWTKIGLTMPVQRLREDSLMEMARHLHSALYAVPLSDSRQIPLPL